MKKCAICKTKFIPVRPMQSTCNQFSCMCEYADKAAAKSAARRAKAERAEIAEKRIKLKTARDWINETQTAANAYVRYRDKDKPCISCGAPLGADGIGGGFDAGHFRSRGAAVHLRFDTERNIHGQCKRCNRHLGGNYSEYRVGLIGRIGIKAVEELEADQTPRKYSIEDLKAIKAEYVAKLKELKRGD